MSRHGSDRSTDGNGSAKTAGARSKLVRGSLALASVLMAFAAWSALAKEREPARWRYGKEASSVDIQDCLAKESKRAATPSLQAPGGIAWGASPIEAHAILSKQYKYTGPQPPDGNPDEFVHEQRYFGQFLGLESDHIAPLFYVGQFFALSASYSPTKERPASLIWQMLMERLRVMYGAPTRMSKPPRIVSKDAVLRVRPDQENAGEMWLLYNKAHDMRDVGHFLLLDMEVQIGNWVPEAVWEFANGTSVKAVMRAMGPTSEGYRRPLKPAVIYAKYDTFK